MVDPRNLRSLRWHGSDELPVGGNVTSNAARLKPGGVFRYLSRFRLARPTRRGRPNWAIFLRRTALFFCYPAEARESLGGRLHRNLDSRIIRREILDIDLREILDHDRHHFVFAFPRFERRDLLGQIALALTRKIWRLRDFR